LLIAPLLARLGVLPTIKLDNQLARKTGKIDDVVANGHLSSELAA
jgi:hypothetical protein